MQLILYVLGATFYSDEHSWPSGLRRRSQDFVFTVKQCSYGGIRVRSNRTLCIYFLILLNNLLLASILNCMIHKISIRPVSGIFKHVNLF